MFSLCWFDLWYFYWSWSPSFAFIDRSLLIWFVELVDFFRLICVFDCFIWMFWFVFVSHFCGVGDSWWFTWADSYWNLWICILWNSLWLDFKLCLACNEDTLRFSLMCILILSVVNRLAVSDLCSLGSFMHCITIVQYFDYSWPCSMLTILFICGSFLNWNW